MQEHPDMFFPDDFFTDEFTSDPMPEFHKPSAALTRAWMRRIQDYEADGGRFRLKNYHYFGPNREVLFAPAKYDELLVGTSKPKRVQPRSSNKRKRAVVTEFGPESEDEDEDPDAPPKKKKKGRISSKTSKKLYKALVAGALGGKGKGKGKDKGKGKGKARALSDEEEDTDVTEYPSDEDEDEDDVSSASGDDDNAVDDQQEAGFNGRWQELEDNPETDDEGGDESDEEVEAHLNASAHRGTRTSATSTSQQHREQASDNAVAGPSKPTLTTASRSQSSKKPLAGSSKPAAAGPSKSAAVAGPSKVASRAASRSKAGKNAIAGSSKTTRSQASRSQSSKTAVGASSKAAAVAGPSKVAPSKASRTQAGTNAIAGPSNAAASGEKSPSPVDDRGDAFLTCDLPPPISVATHGQARLQYLRDLSKTASYHALIEKHRDVVSWFPAICLCLRQPRCSSKASPHSMLRTRCLSRIGGTGTLASTGSTTSMITSLNGSWTGSAQVCRMT